MCVDVDVDVVLCVVSVDVNVCVVGVDVLDVCDVWNDVVCGWDVEGDVDCVCDGDVLMVLSVVDVFVKYYFVECEGKWMLWMLLYEFWEM